MKRASKALDRRGLHEIERLALRYAFHNVEEDDVAELLKTDKVRQRTADLPRTDQCNPVSRHQRKILDWPKTPRQPRSLTLSARAFKPLPTVNDFPPDQVSTIPVDAPDSCEWAAPCGRAK